MGVDAMAGDPEANVDRSRYLTISEVAGMTGLHKNTIRNYHHPPKGGIA